MCNLTARLSVMSLVKIDGSMMKNYLEMLGCSFCTKFDWGCYSFAVAKSTSINLLSGLALNAAHPALH